MALRVYFYIAEAISRKKFETFEEWLRNTLTKFIFAEFSPIRKNLSSQKFQNSSICENESN